MVVWEVSFCIFVLLIFWLATNSPLSPFPPHALIPPSDSIHSVCPQFHIKFSVLCPDSTLHHSFPRNPEFILTPEFFCSCHLSCYSTRLFRVALHASVDCYIEFYSRNNNHNICVHQNIDYIIGVDLAKPPTLSPRYVFRPRTLTGMCLELMRAMRMNHLRLKTSCWCRWLIHPKIQV